MKILFNSKHLFVCLIILLFASNLQAGFLKKQYALNSNTGIPQAPIRVPEGVAFDPFQASFYATALFGGEITRINAITKQETLFYKETTNPVISFSGIKVDSFRRTVWVCAVDLVSNPFPVSTVYAIKIQHGQQLGQLIKVFNLPGPFFCNDVALDAYGNAYVTNSIGDTIYKIERSDLTDPAGIAEQFATSFDFLPDFTQPIVLGLNGIAVTPTQTHLIVAKSVPAQLFKISLADPTQIDEITFTGDSFGQNPDPAGDPLRFLAPDGIVFVRGKLYVTYHGGMQQLKFDDFTYSNAFVKSSTAVPYGLSTATKAYGRLYAIDSETVQVTQPQLGLPVELPHKIVRVKFKSFK